MELSNCRIGGPMTNPTPLDAIAPRPNPTEGERLKAALAETTLGALFLKYDGLNSVAVSTDCKLGAPGFSLKFCKAQWKLADDVRTELATAIVTAVNAAERL